MVRGQNWTSLHHACHAGLEDRVLQLLLVNGTTDVHAQTAAGNTPLALCDAASAAGRAVHALMSRAVLPWSRHTHALFPPACRSLVRTVLLLRHRLNHMAFEGGLRGMEGAVAVAVVDDYAGSERAKRHRRRERGVQFNLPPLSRVLWFEVLGFAVRRPEARDLAQLGFQQSL
jgi:hypothetical protein